MAKSCLTLSNPMDCSPQGPSVHGISQARMLEWISIPFSRGIFPAQGWNPGLLLGRWILSHWAAWEAQRTQLCLKYTLRYIPGPILEFFILFWTTGQTLSFSTVSPSYTDGPPYADSSWLGFIRIQGRVYMCQSEDSRLQILESSH